MSVAQTPIIPFVGTTSFHQRARLLSLALIALGIVTAALAAWLGPESFQRFMLNYVLGTTYFGGIAICSLFFVMLQHVSNAGWSASIRRIPENIASFLPVLAVLMLPIMLNAAYSPHFSIYHWAHEGVVAADPILRGKAGWLNPTAFSIRVGIYVTLWVLLYRYFIGNSRKQDETGDVRYTLKNKSLAPIGLVTFGLSISFFSFDVIMSLQPHWFSTMFGVYFFAGAFVTVLALIGLVLAVLRTNGVLRSYIWADHQHDIGKFTLGFVVFWAYIWFSQFFLIWYANIPEETNFFLFRAEGSWLFVTLLLLFVQFVVPFFALLSRPSKRNPMIFGSVAVLLLVAHYVDLFWQIMPIYTLNQVHELGPEVHGAIPFGWMEVGSFLGFAGLFAFVVLRQFERRSAVALNDPYMAEALELKQ